MLPALVQRMETMPLASVTVVPLSVSVTFGPLVPPPGRLANAGSVENNRPIKNERVKWSFTQLEKRIGIKKSEMHRNRSTQWHKCFWTLK